MPKLCFDKTSVMFVMFINLSEYRKNFDYLLKILTIMEIGSVANRINYAILTSMLII